MTAVLGSFDALAAEILAAPARLGSVRFVAVDGPAGAGKTTFSARLVRALAAHPGQPPPAAGPPSAAPRDAGPVGAGPPSAAAPRGEGRRGPLRVAEVHVDDLLEGWSDLTGYWQRFAEWILDPLASGRAAGYRRYDWHRARFAGEWHPVGGPEGVPDVLVLEGVGSARSAAAAWLTLAVYVTADRDLRLDRGIGRDGEALRGEWIRWMALEDAHFAQDRTVDRVDVVVDGAPSAPHDPERQFVRLCRDARWGGPHRG